MFKLISVLPKNGGTYGVLDTSDYVVDFVTSEQLITYINSGIQIAGVTYNGKHIEYEIQKGLIPSRFSSSTLKYSLAELQRRGCNIKECRSKKVSFNSDIRHMCNFSYGFFSYYKIRNNRIHGCGRLNFSLGLSEDSAIPIHEVYMNDEASDSFTGFVYFNENDDIIDIIICYE